MVESNNNDNENHDNKKMEQVRKLSILDQLGSRLRDTPRKLGFHRGLDIIPWQKSFREKIIELLGPLPAPVPLNVEVIAEEIVDDFEDGGIIPFIQREIVYDTEEHASCIAFLLIPSGMKDGERRPAILSAHGHGSGRKKMVGLDPVTWSKGLNVPNKEAPAIHLVNQGFVVLAPDWRAFGDRSLDSEFCRRGRDPCNVSDMGFGYFGTSLLALNVWDAMRSIDVLESTPEVDPSRIGMVGKSYGGTMTMYTTAMDERVKCAVISGYLSTLDDAISMRGLGNYCGAQYLKGLLEWGDIPDVAGLIAPRPLLIESGMLDDCFVYDDATRAYEKLELIYTACGRKERLSRDVANVGHEYIFNDAIPFLKKYL
ncbi:MAG: alpha/beta hydrolase family protein [Promethearchaeota archaeon]